MPSQIASYIRAENLPQGEWNEAGCRALTVSGAIEVLATSKLETLELQDTLPTGGSRSNLKANPEMVSLRHINTEARTVDAVLDAINDYSLGAAVDYRHVMTTLYNPIFKLDGQLICLAYTGLSARARTAANPGCGHDDEQHLCWRPHRRRRQLPAWRITQCNQKPLQSTVDQHRHLQGLREKPRGWYCPAQRQGGGKKTRERAGQGGCPRASVRTTQRDVVRCSNVCTNGNCVRTFENGRKERWQAPRVYDPFKNDWTWDTDSCGK